MKRVFVLLVSVVICVMLCCACESNDEKAARSAAEQARETEKAYQNALDEYNSLIDYFN